MNATEIAATLSVRAEDVCRRYLPRGRKQGRYWTVGDTNGAKGRSLFVRLAFQAYPRNGPTPRPTSMDICSISSVCAPAEHRCAAPWRKPSHSSHCRNPLRQMPEITPVAMTVKNRRAASGGVAAPSMTPMRKPIYTPAPSAIAASRPCGFILISSIADDNGIHRLPALVAAVTGDDGAIEGVQRTWLDPKRTAPKPTSFARARRSGASTAGPCASAEPPPARPCLPARASKPCYRWSPPSPAFMPRRLYRRAASAPSNHPKISPCWSSPAIKTCKAGTPRTVFSSVAWNVAFPRP